MSVQDLGASSNVSDDLKTSFNRYVRIWFLLPVGNGRPAVYWD
ncbi:hypothetical protein NEIMUCOT_05618 [Neisseria mucosa ATCC 25996]|uniref:Uncharacterized protein n=1 Tax=Neisseria mucosa (strain ATCC 25996 / DSM 4631 / NCTC 10774 / M26) TaxID=546266 RepID=D2ZYB1_NEIM2|nr:hypothetical protein NEIMUCOT_05618 [Neisseria mucosa ATCC 25996]